jgi:hypothetical protein
MKTIETLTATVTAGPAWQTRESREQITYDRWGKDHGQALNEVAYAVRQRSGHMDWSKLTISQRNWPSLFAAKGKLRCDSFGEDAADKYGLRLGLASEGIRLFGHCQGDALMDLADHGLITITMPPVSDDGEHYLKPNGHPLRDDHPVPADLPTGFGELQLMPWAKFGMTERGWDVVHTLDRLISVGHAPTWNAFFKDTLGPSTGRAVTLASR